MLETNKPNRTEAGAAYQLAHANVKAAIIEKSSAHRAYCDSADGPETLETYYRLEHARARLVMAQLTRSARFNELWA